MSSERDSKISLLVRNLPLDVTAEELKDKICKYGEVRDCYLPRDFHTQRPRGFGFVEFAGDRRDAEDAIKALDGSDFRGREITVCFSREARKTPREMLHRDESYRGPERGRDSRDGRDGRDRRSRSRSPRRDRSSRRHSRSPRRERRNNSRSASRSPVRRRRRSPSRSPVPRRSPRRSPHHSPQAPSQRIRSASPARRARSPEGPPQSPENASRSERQQ